MPSVQILTGHAEEVLGKMPPMSVHCCVTSPPYFGLRDYGVDGQIGLEDSPAEYVSAIVSVFDKVWRVLRQDGTLWLNLGDSYSRSPRKGGSGPGKNADYSDSYAQAQTGSSDGAVGRADRPGSRSGGLGEKQLLGIPWRVAFALQEAGWYLRQDIIWSKPNPMPESVKDRCTKAHEYVFLLSKTPQYFYDAEAISEPAIHAGRMLDYTSDQKANSADPGRQSPLPRGRLIEVATRRNKRTVWEIASQPFSEAHFATFPPDLAEICIKAGCPKGGTVLDPFGGAGTTGLVADRLGRDAILIELNPEYAEMSRRRIAGDAGMFAELSTPQPWPPEGER